ncbi:SURF1 family protein [Anaplasma capra]|uniref:SURF1 family protein n=1 Tax=Anaplasma capra TaxID=1562740 RepID=UPI0021D60044|nr:SURF1 family protein [Anaplasma capra]MCU7611324.1 SURF1 family protein [Anaplasma capra]MCU7612810.1 SURF1 family protein [Anaplasma capra]
MQFKVRGKTGWVLLVAGCLIPFATLISLGTWQLLRLRWKSQIIEKMRTEPVSLPPGELRAHAYRRVKLQGAFKGAEHIRVFAGRAGYYFLQPFTLVDGRHVLVNRGMFVDESEIAGISDEGMRFISGVLHCELRSMANWVVRNNPEENLWFWFDIRRMSERIELPDLEPCILWGDHTTVFGALNANFPLSVRRDHLEYAITWYLLAFTWILGYAYYACKARCALPNGEPPTGRGS